MKEARFGGPSPLSAPTAPAPVCRDAGNDPRIRWHNKTLEASRRQDRPEPPQMPRDRCRFPDFPAGIPFFPHRSTPRESIRGVKCLAAELAARDAVAAAGKESWCTDQLDSPLAPPEAAVYGHSHAAQQHGPTSKTFHSCAQVNVSYCNNVVSAEEHSSSTVPPEQPMIIEFFLGQ